jgi:hypothetical protein
MHRCRIAPGSNPTFAPPVYPNPTLTPSLDPFTVNLTNIPQQCAVLNDPTTYNYKRYPLAASFQNVNAADAAKGVVCYVAVPAYDGSTTAAVSGKLGSLSASTLNDRTKFLPLTLSECIAAASNNTTSKAGLNVNLAPIAKFDSVGNFIGWYDTSGTAQPQVKDAESFAAPTYTVTGGTCPIVLLGSQFNQLTNP